MQTKEGKKKKKINTGLSWCPDYITIISGIQLTGARGIEERY